MNSMDKRYVILGLSGLVLCAGIVMLGVGISYFEQSDNDVTIDRDSENYVVNFDPSLLRLTYTRSSDEKCLLSVFMGQSADGRGEMMSYPRIVQSCQESDPVCTTVTYTIGPGQAELKLSVTELSVSDVSQNVKCYETTWSSTTDDVAPVDCFPMSDYWFGGAEMYYQHWPVNSWDKFMSFYLSGDMFEDAQQFGSVLERYWLSSSGVALYVPPDVPLHLSIENQRICFKGAYGDPYKIRNEALLTHWLKYTACFGDSPQVTHDFMFKKYFKRPNALPDLRMMKSPIWSSWARYKVNINQSTILQYANEILEYNFTNSQIEIDDGYEVRYGDHTFDPVKFPNASEMIQTLHDLGFRVTTWVTPFINPRSENYNEGDVNKYFVLNGAGESGRVPWWNGIGSAIDFTDPDACDWYSGLLDDVRTRYGVDSFKFDAGEINYVTVVPNFELFTPMQNLGYYTRHYAECAFRLGYQIEVRSAWDCHHLPIFVRMMDKDSNWSEAKGLKSLIPTALTFTLLGYPYVLPDMIGGNAYEAGFHGTPLPERELFIRWLEITAFLPSMQFSYTPWQYDDVTIKLSRDYVTLHETVVFEELKKASEEYVAGKSGIGPIRPIWWVTYDDVKAFTVDDEFMVGDRYLVAPIVNNGSRSRDVYLPGPTFRDGARTILWEDKLRGGAPIAGGVTLSDYRIELEEISWWELTLK
ncbi:myogenesis-regulating glycosidase-like [Clavelina lepadiformis]|uniref:Uncharacterized protein n=1 Tax=Clavelina lepadiformis TaxID=159417 RepID=A0ABP0GDE5_CLALP